MDSERQHLQLPSLRMALFQFAVSCANWMVMGCIIWLLLARQVDYPIVLGVLLISSIAGMTIHSPAGIGVLEAVFLALLAYRVLYFVLPLALYLWLESRAEAFKAEE